MMSVREPRVALGKPRHGQAARIAVVTGGIPHYRWPFFAALANRGIDVHLITAGRLPAGMLATPSPDSRIELRHLDAGRRGWRSDVLKALRQIAPDVVLLEHGSALDYSWTTLLSGRVKAPRILWTHGIARQELYGRQTGPASWGRWVQLSLADGILCYDEVMARTMAARYPRKIIGSAPNSTDGSAIASQRMRCEEEGRAAVRAGLGLGAQLYLAGLGRLVAEKDFSRLLRVAAALRSAGVDVGVILIGSGPEERALRDEARALGMHNPGDVVFAGGISDQEVLARWLYSADACVSPGPLGLSTVDCLFAGVPVISYEPSARGVHHGPEWRYLRAGKTGWFADEYSDDALAFVCKEYLGRPEESRASVRAACAEYARGHLGIERMVDGMMDVVTAALRNAGRGEASR